MVMRDTASEVLVLVLDASEAKPSDRAKRVAMIASSVMHFTKGAALLFCTLVQCDQFTSSSVVADGGARVDSGTPMGNDAEAPVDGSSPTLDAVAPNADAGPSPCSNGTHLLCQDFEGDPPSNAAINAQVLFGSSPSGGSRAAHFLKTSATKALAEVTFDFDHSGDFQCDFDFLTTKEISAYHEFFFVKFQSVPVYEVGLRTIQTGSLQVYEFPGGGNSNGRPLLDSISSYGWYHWTLKLAGNVLSAGSKLGSSARMDASLQVSRPNAATRQFAFGVPYEEGQGESETWDIYIDNIVCDTL
jgi:hypothetical protein